MIKVYMAGLIYLHGCTTGAKRALVPDGTAFDPRHYASIFVEPDRVKSYDWWKGQKFVRTLTFDDASQATVLEFRIPTRAEVIFPDDDNAPAQFVKLEQNLPHLETTKAPPFEIDLDYPETISEVPIRGGRLEAYDFRREEQDPPKVAIVQWTIANDSDEVTIHARSLYDSKKVTLENCKCGSGLEIVFSNTSDLISVPGSHGDPKSDHFILYHNKLNKNRHKQQALKPPQTSTTLHCLHFNHSYLRYLQDKGRLPDAGCTPTCC